jgi:hypothetical protein
VRMGRPYDVSPAILLVGVRPPVDTGKRRLFHGKVTTEAIPRAFGNVWRRGMREGGVRGTRGAPEASFILRYSPRHTREDHREIKRSMSSVSGSQPMTRIENRLALLCIEMKTY